MSAAYDKERYTSPAWAERERARLWPRVWQIAGLAADVAEPGAWLTYDCAGESMLVVRGDEGVRAFYNVCLHRGRVLCEGARGCAPSLRCAYHHWEYALDGRLARVPREAAFDGVRPEGLTPLACETFAGFIWVCAQPAETLAAWLGPLAPRLEAHALEGFALAQDDSVEVACNWKVSVDAFNEAYHLRSVHPELSQHIDLDGISHEVLGRHSVIHTPLRGAGSQPQYFVFPHTSIAVRDNDVMVLRHRAHFCDNARMTLDQWQLEQVAPGGRRPARPQTRTGGSLGAVTDQDLAQMAAVQRGLGSRGFRGPALGAEEVLVRHMHRVLDDYVGAV